MWWTSTTKTDSGRRCPWWWRAAALLCKWHPLSLQSPPLSPLCPTRPWFTVLDVSPDWFPLANLRKVLENQSILKCQCSMGCADYLLLHNHPPQMHGLETINILWSFQKPLCWLDAIGHFLCRVLRVPWTARRSNQSILKEISPEYSLEGLMLKLKLQNFGHLMQRTDSFEDTLMLGKIKGWRRKGW